jgi:cell envelope opacity-associated protein A
MTHRTVVNCETGVVTQVEYTAEEQAVHDAAVAAQAAELEAAAIVAQQEAEAQAATAIVATPTEPAT